MKKIILFNLTIIVTSILSCTQLDEIKELTMDKEVVKFQLINAKTRTPVENETLYLSTYQVKSCMPMPVIIDSITTSSNGYFSIPKNMFAGGSFLFSIKNKEKRRKINSLSHSSTSDNIQVNDYLDGFNKNIGISNYDLSSNLVSHKNFYEKDSISKTFERIELKLYSKSKYRVMEEKLDLLLKTSLSTKKVLNNIWDYYFEVATNSLQEVNRNYEEIDILLRLTSHLQYLINQKQEVVDLKIIFEIIDESDDIRKKYNFLYLACKQVNNEILEEKPVDILKVKKLLNRIDNFILKNQKFIDNKIEFYWYGKSIGVDCHPLQRVKGELLMRTDKNSNRGPSVKECCTLGK